MFSHKERSRTRFLTEQGKEAVVAILGPGHFFGEGCLNGHPLRIATTTAIDECVITRLEKATMIATIHNEAGFAIAPLQLLRFTTTCLKSVLAGQLGRFASSLRGASFRPAFQDR